MKLKLSLLFALLGALPTLAAGNSIDYDTGIFHSGSLLGSLQDSVNVTITGSLNTIDVITGALVKTTAGCPTGSTCFDFSSGSVKVIDTTGTVFFDTLTGGIAIEQDGSASLQGVLTTLAGKNGLTAGSVTATFDFSGMKITSGSADVSFQRTAATPELGTLLLLGTGLSGIAAQFFRRKAKLVSA